MKFTLIAEKMLCGRIDTLEADLRKKQQKVDQLNAQIEYLMNLPGLGDCECCDGTGEVDDSAGGWGPAAYTKSMCPDCEGTGVGVSDKGTGEKP